MYKIIYLFLTKSSILVGGQAVIEGVMMRVPGAYATAVRLKDKSIQVQRKNFVSIIEKYHLKNYVIIRGVVHLYESMKMGYQTLDWSANMQEGGPDFKNKDSLFNKIQDFVLSILSFLFAIGLFLFLPLFFTNFFDNIINHPLFFNIVSGLIRISIFLIYLILISQLKDVRRLFQYHGAEHKVVYNFESGDDLNINNAKTFSTLHPRCGTSFVFIIMLVTIFSHAIIDYCALFFVNELTIFLRLILHIIFLPLIAGFGYEVLKFLAKKQNNILFSLLSRPGLWLQKITTKEPTDNQLEVSLCALKTAFGEDKIQDFQGKKFIADAIG